MLSNRFLSINRLNANFDTCVRKTTIKNHCKQKKIYHFSTINSQTSKITSSRKLQRSMFVLEIVLDA